MDGLYSHNDEDEGSNLGLSLPCLMTLESFQPLIISFLTIVEIILPTILKLL